MLIGLSSPIPASYVARNLWITSRRGPTKNDLDPARPYAWLHECELNSEGRPASTATIFLTNRECPFRCTMCDLWRNTLDYTVASGAIAGQIEYTLDRMEPAEQIKLYNAGSFFDPRAIPPDDYPDIAKRLAPFERVIVESHPAFLGDACLRFRDLVAGRLEVAVGLETANPEVLDLLNKRFTVDDFLRSAAFLAANDIDLRVFLLLRPPFTTEEEGMEWAIRSLEISFDAGASVCCVIPTRAGNGAMESLAEHGLYAPPNLRSLETVVEWGVGSGRGRVFADLWDIERFFTCACSPARAARLASINQTQTLPTPVACANCALAPA